VAIWIEHGGNIAARPPCRYVRAVQWVRQIPVDVRLFVAMMALLVPVRVAQTAQVRAVFVDGAYYLEVAKHVRDGKGLVSNLSLYHFGYETFPYPTSIYPLWPWLLGMTARVLPLDLETLGRWLSLSLSFTAVIAAFLFGRRLWPEPLLPRHVPGLHAGHVFALGLAVQAEFVFYTCLPYTEALAWTLLFLFAWRVVAQGASLGLGWAVEIAVWLSLLYFSRYQLLVVPLALAGAYAVRIVLGPDRGRVALHATVALGLFGAALGAWFLHLRTFVVDAGVLSLLRFDQNRANHLLHPIDVIVAHEGPLDLLADRAFGVLYAWDAASGASYTPSFYTLHWALPVALGGLGWGLWQQVRREGWASVLQALRRPEAVPWLFIVLFAAGGLLSVHAIHKHYNGQWYFASRQGLMSLPAFLLCLGWLLRQSRPLLAAAGIWVLCSTSAVGTRTLWAHATTTPEELLGEEAFSSLTAWMNAHKDEDGKLVVAMDSVQVQRLGWLTEGVGYHWITAKTSYDDVLTMTDQLGARYVILRPRALEKDRGWKLLADEQRFAQDFVLLPQSPGQNLIYERRR
jgi:hypothetical protein